jgi:RNA polymerase sigma-70 factor (ECF subfamily)
MHPNEAERPVPTPEQVARDHGPRVYTLARRMLGNDSDAEDITQDVLLQVLRKLDSFRGESAFPTWLHRVVVNAVLAFRRRRATHPELPLDHAKEEFHPDGSHVGPVRRWMAPPEEQALDREAHAVIEDAIRQLPEVYRDVYVLADVEGMPNAEIAEVLELSVPAVKSRLHRARLLMREALAPYFEETAA